MILLVDIGNTLIKIAHNDEQTQAITMIAVIETKNEKWLANVIMALQEVKTITGSIISSVVPQKLEAINALITKQFKIKPIILSVNYADQLPVKLHLPHQQIGSDLLALAVGAASNNPNQIVISLGTATTYTIIKDNALIGVIIGPGFTNTKLGLSNNAALITPFTLKPYASVLGNNTNHALSIGFGNGFNYMLTNTIKAINAEVNSNLPVLITGNAYDELKPFLQFPYHYQKAVLMIGLLIIYQTLQKNNKLNNK